MKHLTAILAALALAACASPDQSGTDTPANCGRSGETYASMNADPIVIATDNRETWSAWRDDAGVIYFVRSVKDQTCIVHVGHEVESTPL